MMTNVGRRGIFVQFQIKTEHPLLSRDDPEQKDNLDDRSSGPWVTGNRVQDKTKKKKLCTANYSLKAPLSSL